MYMYMYFTNACHCWRVVENQASAVPAVYIDRSHDYGHIHVHMYCKTAMVDETTEVVEAELCMVISLLATTCMARKTLRRNCAYIHEFV